MRQRKIVTQFFVGTKLKSALESLVTAERDANTLLDGGLLMAAEYHCARLEGRNVYIENDGNFERIEEVLDLRESYVPEFPDPFDDEYVMVTKDIDHDDMFFLRTLARRMGCRMDDIFDDTATFAILAHRLEGRTIYVERNGFIEPMKAPWENEEMITRPEPRYVM